MRAVALALLAALALAAAGCGGSHENTKAIAATPLERVSQAVTLTTAKSATFHMTITEKSNGIGPFTFTADGASDSANRSATMSLDLSAIAALVNKGKVGHVSDWQANVILDGTDAKNPVEYLKLPALMKGMGTSKPWVKIELNKLSGVGNINVTTLLQSAGQQDPTQSLRLLQSVGNVKPAGSVQLDGIATTHYTGTIDPKKIAARLGDTGLAPVVAASGAQSIPVDVWIDGDGYVRKLVESVKGSNATLDITTTLSDFGAKVDVSPPPADQTTDLSALQSK